MPGQVCVVGGCSNRATEERSLHTYPTDQTLWPPWDRFVRSTRRDFQKGNKRTIVCSAHFKEDEFSNLMKFRMKFATKLLLKPGAIPSIRPIGTLSTPSIAAEKKHRNVLAMKLQLAREATENRHVSVQGDAQAKSPPACTSVAPDQASISDDDFEDNYELNVSEEIPMPDLHEGSCSQLEKHNKGVQARVRHRSKRILAKPLVADVSVQHGKSCMKPSCADMAVQCSLISAPPLSLFPSTSAASQQDETEKKLENTQPDQAERLNLPEPRPAAHLEDKYIVFQRNLLLLFDTCPKCAESATAHIAETVGTCIRILQTCTNEKCGFSRVWASQPFQQKMPLGNLLLSSAILFSGSLPAKALRVLQLLNVRVFNVSTFFRHQHDYLFPIVELEWEQEQREIIRQLKDDGQPLVLVGDGRSDSPGHCAKYGSYTVIDQRINKVIDVQVVQSNEVKNSTWCELEGLQRTLAVLTDRGLTVNTIVTDRHPQITKYLRDHHDGVQHLFDIWHVAKGVWKKLDKLSQVKGCEDVGLWKKAIRNHLYWAAVSTPSDCGETKKAKWMSLLYHIQDIHSGLPGPHFPACEHGDLEKEQARQWLEPTTKAFTSLEKIIADKRLLNDVARLSSGDQTSNLEAFHSLLLHFAPKHTAFSWLGMRTRHKLAAMHYNENNNRDQATTKEGEPRFQVYYGKAKNFEARVRPVTTEHTYRYAVKLQGALLQRHSEGPGTLRKSIDHIREEEPGYLTEKADRVPRDEAVANHLHRFRPRQTMCEDSDVPENDFDGPADDDSYHSEHKLAAMHYKENNSRDQTTTKEGEPRFQVYYGKAKNFEAHMRPVTTGHTDMLLNCKGPSSRGTVKVLGPSAKALTTSERKDLAT